MFFVKTKEQAALESVNLLEEHKIYLRKWFREPWYNNLSLFDEYTDADDEGFDPILGSEQSFPDKML